MRLFISAFLLIPFLSDAQGTLNLSEMNVLWNGYENKIEIASGQFKKKFRVVGENMKLTPNGKNKYIVIVHSNDKEAKIHVVSRNGKDTLKTYTYRIMVLTNPAITLGYSSDGGIISMNDTILHAGYGPNINFADDSFEIIDYSLQIWDYEVSELKGEGNVLSAEIQNIIRNIPKDDKPKTISIQLRVKGPDGVIRKRMASYRLI